ncbi:uncharacterized protein H6S33_007975 [Morchella sextelata]|jgi:ribosomal protein S17|uniref:uncharacterized protein n=1 Tax=Morchella sextelata TaxID=1174677 RepID=UPI001D05AA77|nr:uncharacterized protein H6S33_007975 [Morchella sextelata]KAH0602971.1 hypothetical protein H6S33_007975 [Morchella sextelata]
MAFNSPIFNPQQINILSNRIEVLKAELCHSHSLLERYVRQLARMHTHGLNAVYVPVAGDIINISNEELTARISALTFRIVKRKRLTNSLEMRLGLLLEANRWVWLL